ncbi:HNH endonuclease [Streptomyces coeruleorubidus]
MPVQDRVCECGHKFRGTNFKCSRCRAGWRTCKHCEREFHGHGRVCGSCAASQKRTCDNCGKSFKGVNRRCKPCRKTKRNCSDCGREIVSDMLKCSTCQAIERECTDCRDIFIGKDLKCWQCRKIERDCWGCGETFVGATNYCDVCRDSDRNCTDCGVAFTGKRSRCNRCQIEDRECDGCGRGFRSAGNRRCSACRAKDRACPECNRIFRATRSICPGCEATDKVCVDCHSPFWGRDRRCGPCNWQRTPAEIRTNRSRAYYQARRARLHGTDSSDRVTEAEYASIRADGQCVYCGRLTTDGDVDHIRPLTLGGRHEVTNLVLACIHCNRSKNNSLLIRWRPDRVEHACRISEKVRAEYERQLVESAVGP